MPNRSKVADRRFWRRWCDSGAVANIDGLCVDFWMIKRFRPRVHGARATIYVNGRPLGHVVSFTPLAALRDVPTPTLWPSPPPAERRHNVDAETLAALGEARLTPAEKAAVVARLSASDHAALRDVFPAVHAALFGPEA